MKAIWIADDDQSIRFVLEKALQREQLPTRSFTNAQEVLAALADCAQTGGGGPQVLVSDIRMPGESGLALLARVRASHPALPVIVMTAYSDLDSAVSAFQGGAFEYLPKPFDVPKAVELVRRAKAAGWITALVSGGFHEVIDELAAEIGIDHVRANRFEIIGGRFTGRVSGPIIDGAAKRGALEEFAAQHQVPTARIVAMGDGANDREMLVAAGTGIAFRAKPALREIADVVIDGESLLDAWPHLERIAEPAADQ